MSHIFRVPVQRTETGFIVVNANSREEAAVKAEQDKASNFESLDIYDYEITGQPEMIPD